MDDSGDRLALDDGGEHPTEDWVAAAAGVLRKAGRLGEDDADDQVWARLTRRTLDGIEVSPLGTPELVADLSTHGRPTRHGAWDVRARLVVADEEQRDAARAAALEDLDGGVTSLWLELPGPTDLARLLDGVLLGVAPVVLDAPAWAGEAARGLLAAAAEGGLHPDTNLGADPVGARLRGADEAEDQLVEIATLAADAGVRAVVVDASAVHDLGASDAQELGYGLALGVAYLRRLTGSGLDLGTALGLLEFRYAATDEQFPTIAKLRAARRVWARVVELCDGRPEDAVQRQHVVTSRPMMGKYDPWVNLLRGTVAAFAAGVGGADAITVLPFDAPLGRPDAMSRRIARNTSALLIEESHVAAVTDPAGGSYAVERLTDDLAAAAWAELDAIEAAGGIEAVLDAGDYLPRLEETVAERSRQVATRKRPLTGISEFPNLHEELPERDPDPAERPVRRYGADFEAMRDAPPSSPVFLATVGSVAAHTARATYATNLLAAGGVDVVASGATDDVDAVLEAYRSQDSPAVVCLAGADKTYAEWGADLVAALRRAGATWVVVAGRPSVGGTDLGVDDANAVGGDALAFLTTIREHLS
ncbi:methylmalonyl-CoA mutase [Marmoricola endophyticus]|uniref:Methylmalonyl-CoA mutase n=1 Tax=Marmoricola endophyticus TaxID=2040280 RepID=A0A917BG49_9ACTN|nr:methylmalonyl-CoA mutase family protein [Marmoricola endophyticus]GGF40785.1 methylmalonyl-CoA mutase [Marmoricola endophyticus]